jgi:hypothetical protein
MTVATALAILLGAGQPAIMPNLTDTQKRIVQQHSQSKGGSTRLTPSGKFQRYLLPHNKESFKQARRKQLKAKSKRRAKKLGQA